MYNIYTDILLMLYIIGIIPSGRFSEFENEAFLLYCPQYMLCFLQMFEKNTHPLQKMSTGNA